MSLIPWPNKRIQYAGIDNPRYVSDIVAANEAVIDSIKALAGLSDTDFAIINGLVYNSVSHTYSQGIFYLNGLFYFTDFTLVEGNFLAGSAQPIMSKAFQDGNSRPIYTSYKSVSAGSGGAGYSPAFSGTMNAYRINSKFMASQITAALSVIATLGDAAFLNVGSTAGTVAAGDDPRLVYTLSDFNSLFDAKADKTGVLNLIQKGTRVVGTVPPSGAVYTVSFGTTLPDALYDVMITMIGLSSTHSDDTICAPLIRAKNTNGFDVYLNAPNGASAGNVNFDWVVFK